MVAILHAFRLVSDSPAHITALGHAVIILPLLVGMFASLYASYRPMLKFGAAYAAAKRIEKEIFLSRCGVRPYRPVKRVPGAKSHRHRFAEAIQSIWSECADSDMKVGRFHTRGGLGQHHSTWMWRESDDGDERLHVNELLTKLHLPSVYDTFGTLDADIYIEHRVCENIYEMQRWAGFYNRSKSAHMPPPSTHALLSAGGICFGPPSVALARGALPHRCC